MAFYKKTIRDVPLDGLRVLVRADYNVPLKKNGDIADDYRMTQSLPTLQHLLDRGCQVVICSHLGRPKGQVKEEFSLEPVAAHLGELLGQPVGFVPDCVGDRVMQAAKRMQPGQVLLLENLRFHPEEEANDEAFARSLAKDCGASYFVQDGFGVVHRAHASTQAITQFLPSVAGLLLEQEVTTITDAMEHPKRPLVAVLGGAKVSDKIKVIQRFVKLADRIIIGGAMANTFLKYTGAQIGKSVHEAGQESILQEIYADALQKTRGKSSVDEFLVLPCDVVVAKSLEEGAEHRVTVVGDVAEDEYIVDLGYQTAQNAVTLLKDANTAIWNGTLGLAEQAEYADASAKVAAALASQEETMSLIGGGDTVDFVLDWSRQHQDAHFGHISTGGGASLELMAGDKLPGVEALMDS